jgi:CheY-like chemotaxis protein
MKRGGRRSVATGSRIAPGPSDPAASAVVPMVLIADDDPDAQAIYGSYLSSLGCLVFVARDGVEAVEKAVRLRPDVIVMDLVMPHLDGSRAIERLKTQGRTKDIPIIVLSGDRAGADRVRRVGCEVFLDKPCLPERLWWQIRLLLELLDDRPPPSACSL